MALSAFSGEASRRYLDAGEQFTHAAELNSRGNLPISDITVHLAYISLALAQTGRRLGLAA